MPYNWLKVVGDDAPGGTYGQSVGESLVPVAEFDIDYDRFTFLENVDWASRANKYVALQGGLAFFPSTPTTFQAEACTPGKDIYIGSQDGGTPIDCDAGERGGNVRFVLGSGSAAGACSAACETGGVGGHFEVKTGAGGAAAHACADGAAGGDVRFLLGAGGAGGCCGCAGRPGTLVIRNGADSGLGVPDFDCCGCVGFPVGAIGRKTVACVGEALVVKAS